ncbi:transposase [Streptomyces scabiei]|uniref:transposase n=1 Tax=Streptomyces scabiei TaxID=1930 RepID=UPI0036E3CB30
MGSHTGPSPVDRGRTGSKDHLIIDGHGTPLAVLLTGGSRNDVPRSCPCSTRFLQSAAEWGRPRRKPDSLFAGRGYDHDIYRDQVRERGIVPAIARRGTRHGTGLGTYRWAIERSLAWLHGFRRLRIRWERRADMHEAFLKPACCQPLLSAVKERIVTPVHALRLAKPCCDGDLPDLLRR